MYMNLQQMLIAQFSRLKRGTFYLSVVWILGIVLGAAVVVFSGDIYLIVKDAAASRPDFSLLFISNALPIAFLMAILAARRYGLIFFLIFVYGLLHGFCGMCTVFAFGSSGWLVRLLLLFSSSMVSVFMWWLVFSFDNRKSSVMMVVFGSLLFVSLVTLVDYFAISPFLIGVL